MYIYIDARRLRFDSGALRIKEAVLAFPFLRMINRGEKIALIALAHQVDLGVNGVDLQPSVLAQRI